MTTELDPKRGGQVQQVKKKKGRASKQREQLGQKPETKRGDRFG